MAANPTSSITTAFAVPMIVSELPESAGMNAELRELFLQCEKHGNKYANPEPYTRRNSALFESAFNLFDWPNPAVARMRDFCMARLYETIGQLNGYDTATLQRLHVAHESWFHITRKSGYFGVHNHPMHSWSGVYCVCHEGDEGESDSGMLTFISPYVTNTMYMDMAMHKLKAPFALGNRSMRLQPGQLVLFPSWMLHEVTAFEPGEEGMRITVAFNARFMMQDVKRHEPVYPGR